VDDEWFSVNVRSFKSIVTIDNHYFEGGLGQKLNSVLTLQRIYTKVTNFAVNGIPASGQPAEVLDHHGLDVDSLFNSIRSSL
jgi:transketolase